MIIIAKGMTYLSTHNPIILHRDLSVRNILCVEENNRLHCKIADFGIFF